MESPLDFQPDFEKTSRPPMTETLNNEAPKEDVPYIETEHKGNKVYVCTFPNCSKAFKYQSQANRHSIVHKKDRPFPCTYKGCNKSFKRADILETHMQLHTENLPFACDQPGCDRRFASKPALKYHQVKHVNNRGFKCYVEGCGKSFLVASQLKQHVKAMHPDAVPPPESTTEEERPIDPETEKEFQQFLAAPYSRAEWQLMTLSCQEQQTEETQEYFRVFFNYIINQLRVLKEQVSLEPESQRPAQVNADNFNFGSALQNSFSEFAKLTEHFDSDEFKFLDFLRESADNTS